MGMAVILLKEQWPFVQIFTPFDRRLHMKIEENWARGLRGEVAQRCGWTDDRWTMDNRWQTMDDGRGVITTAHPEPLVQVS